MKIIISSLILFLILFIGWIVFRHQIDHIVYLNRLEQSNNINKINLMLNIASLYNEMNKNKVPSAYLKTNIKILYNNTVGTKFVINNVKLYNIYDSKIGYSLNYIETTYNIRINIFCTEVVNASLNYKRGDRFKLTGILKNIDIDWKTVRFVICKLEKL